MDLEPLDIGIDNFLKKGVDPLPGPWYIEGIESKHASKEPNK